MWRNWITWLLTFNVSTLKNNHTVTTQPSDHSCDSGYLCEREDNASYTKIHSHMFTAHFLVIVPNEE